MSEKLFETDTKEDDRFSVEYFKEKQDTYTTAVDAIRETNDTSKNNWPIWIDK